MITQMKAIDHKLNDKSLVEVVARLEEIVLRLEKVTEKWDKNLQTNSSISLKHLGEIRM